MCGKMFIKMHVSKENYIGPFKTHPTENSQWEEKGPRLPRWLSGKESAFQSRRGRFKPWVRKTPREGNGTPLQYSFLGNPMDRGPWWAVIHKGCKESDMTEQLSMEHYLINRMSQPTSCPCKNYLNCHYYPFLSFQK